MSNWTTGDILAELEQEGIETFGLSHRLQPWEALSTVTMLHSILTLAAATERDETSEAEHKEKLTRLVDLWAERWPDVRAP